VKLSIRKVTGDKSGLLVVNPGTQIHVETHNIRTHAPVNYDILASGELYLPLLTVINGNRAPALKVHGVLRGIEELRIYKGSHASVYIQGSSFCKNCPPYTGQYSFKKVKIMQGASFTVNSNSQNIKTKTVTLNIQQLSLDYTGTIKGDVANMFTNFMNLEYDASVDFSHTGWPASSGPGFRSGCGSLAGAGHGGKGGSGCTSCSVDGKQLEICTQFRNS
jgi:hypothetical protein